MPENTKYSRATRNKNQLRQTMSTPRYGVNACSLCDRGRLPDDLSFKVSKYKTCADVHLELALLKPDASTCIAGQAQYREICCAQSSNISDLLPSIKKPTMAIAFGLFLFWVFTKRVSRRVKQHSTDDDNEDEYHHMDEEDCMPKRGRRSKSENRIEMASSAKKTRKRSKSRELGKQSRRISTGQTHRSKSSRSADTRKIQHIRAPKTHGVPSLMNSYPTQNMVVDEYHLEDPQQDYSTHSQTQAQSQYYASHYQQDDLPMYDQDTYHLDDVPYPYPHPGYPQEDVYYSSQPEHTAYVEETGDFEIYGDQQQHFHGMHHEDESTLNTEPLGGAYDPSMDIETMYGEETAQAVLTQVV